MPVALKAGTHRLRVKVSGDGPPQLQLRFGGPGVQHRCRPVPQPSRKKTGRTIGGARLAGGPAMSGLTRAAGARIALQHAHAPVLRQLHQIGDRRLVEGGIRVERPTAVEGKHIAVRAGLVRRRQPFGCAGSIQPLRGRGSVASVGDAS